MEVAYMLLSIPATIFLVMGLIFLLVIKNINRPAKDWQMTTGTIIRKEKNYSISLGKIFNKEGIVSSLPDSAPTFQYEVNGIEYEKTSKVQQNPGFAIGSTVEILYNPEDPQQAVINSIIQRGTLFSVLGKIFISISVILLFIVLLIFIFN